MEGGSYTRHAKVGVRSNTIGRQGFTDVLEICRHEWISHVTTSNGTASGYAATARCSSAPREWVATGARLGRDVGLGRATREWRWSRFGRRGSNDQRRDR